MSDPVVDKIQKNPKYLELRKKRSGFGWFLTLLMMVNFTTKRLNGSGLF